MSYLVANYYFFHANNKSPGNQHNQRFDQRLYHIMTINSNLNWILTFCPAFVFLVCIWWSVLSSMWKLGQLLIHTWIIVHHSWWVVQHVKQYLKIQAFNSLNPIQAIFPISGRIPQASTLVWSQSLSSTTEMVCIVIVLVVGVLLVLV